MKASERRRLLEPVLLPRAIEMLGDEITANGSPLAHAVTTIAALEVDRLAPARGTPAERATHLDETGLGRIAALVREKLSEHYGPLVELPSGTEIRSQRMGAIKYGGTSSGPYSSTGGRCYQLSMAAPGLFLDEDLPDDGEVMERFRRELLHALRPWRAADIPNLTLDDIVVRRSRRWGCDISLPIRCVAGETMVATFQTRRLDIMTSEDWDTEIKGFVAREASHQRLGRQLDADTIRLRGIVTALLKEAANEGMPLRLIETQVHPDGAHHGGKTQRTFTIQALDNALRLERWSISVTEGNAAATDGMVASLRNQIGIQRRRAKLLAQSLEMGASGRIDTITLAALRTADEPVAGILRRLVEVGRTSVSTPDHGTMRLSWKNGVVHSSFAISPQVSWSYGRLIVKNQTFPQTVLQAIIGRPISDVVGHDMMDPNATVRSIGKSHNSWTTINVTVASVAFDHKTGIVMNAKELAKAA